jgi:hypothetical protein
VALKQSSTTRLWAWQSSSANGAGANMGLEAFWKQVQAQQSANAGKLPVVEFKGSRPEKVGKGTHECHSLRW